MTFAILMGTAAFVIVLLLRLALPHLRESVGPYTLDPHEYDDAWKLAHKA